MPQVRDRDIEAIQNWIAKEPHLPNTFDELVIKKFLFSCDNSLERTKRCLDEFCSRRAAMPEVYADRDPVAKELQTVFDTSTVTTYIAGDTEVLIHKLFSIDQFNFFDCLKAFTIQADTWIRRALDPLPVHHVIVIDLQVYTAKIIPKMNIFFLQKFLVFLLESMPVRVTQVHIINCPSFVDYLYGLVKPALPDYICHLVTFHPSHLGLHKYIDKKYLPADYDGLGPSMRVQSQIWVDEACDKRKSFLDDGYWRADLSKKPKTGGAADCMNGSFRTLVID